jgi:hypothetical protein
MFLSGVTAALPVSPRIACAELDGCVVAGPGANEAVVVDETQTDGPDVDALAADCEQGLPRARPQSRPGQSTVRKRHYAGSI